MFRFIYSFAHLESSNTKVPMSYLGPNGRFGFQGERPFLTKSDGFRNYFANFADSKGQRYTYLNLTGLGIVFKKRVIIGFRYNTYGTVRLFHIGPNIYAFTALFSCTYLEANSMSAGYAEVVIDFDALTTTLFINGISRKVQKNTPEQQAAFATQTTMLACDMAGGTPAADVLGVSFTDYYVRDSEGEIDPIVPLGNVSPQLVRVTDVVGTLINPTTPAAAVANLNAVVTVDVAAPPTAYIDDAAANSTFTAKMNTAVTAGRIPAAVCMFASAYGGKRPAISWKVGSNAKVVATDTFPLSAGAQYVSAIGALDLAPDGQKWTWDKINQLSVEMTFP